MSSLVHLREACLRGLLVLAIAIPSMAADPRLLSLIPGDAEAVLGANVHTILGSGLVKELMSGAGGNVTQDLELMINATGMDPRRDIAEVMVAGFAPRKGAKDPAKNNGLAFISGNFDPERIGSLMVQQGGSKLAYKGKTLWVPAKQSNPDKDMLTFLDSSVLVAGSERQVKRFLDGGLGQLSAKLRSQVNDVSGRYDLWMVSATSPATLANSLGSAGSDAQQMAGPMQGEMLEKIESVQGGLKFGSQMLLGLEMNANTAEDATALLNVLQFFKSMLAGSPSGKGGPPAGVQKMLSAIEMRTESKTLLLSMSMAEQDVVEFLRNAAKQAAASPRSSPSDEPGAEEEIRVAEPQQQQEEIIIIQ